MLYRNHAETRKVEPGCGQVQFAFTFSVFAEYVESTDPYFKVY